MVTVWIFFGSEAAGAGAEGGGAGCVAITGGATAGAVANGEGPETPGGTGPGLGEIGIVEMTRGAVFGAS